MRRLLLLSSVILLSTLPVVSSVAASASTQPYKVVLHTLTDGYVGPGAVTKGSDGNIWFTECYTTACDGSAVARLSHGVITNFPVPGTPGWGDGSLTPGPDGALYFAQGGPNGYIGRFTTSGQLSYPVPSVEYPGQIVFDSAGNLWFATDGPPGEGTNGSIGELILATGTVTYFSAGTDIPADLTVGPDGNIWFTNWGNNTIAQLVPSTGAVTVFTNPGMVQPAGIVTGQDGALWFVNMGNNSIGRITTTGQVTTYSCTGMSHTSLIISAPNGNLWFGSGNALGEITLSGAMHLYFSWKIRQPGVLMDPRSSIWFTDSGRNAVGMFKFLS